MAPCISCSLGAALAGGRCKRPAPLYSNSLFFLLKLLVRLGRNGVEEVLGLAELADFEKEGLENLKGELKSSIEKGINFANAN